MTSDAPRTRETTSGAEAGEAGRVGSMPVLRAFRSPRFRLLVAVIAVLFGLAINGLRLIAFDLADASVAVDVPAFYFAAERMVAGSSPYLPAQVEVPGVGHCYDCYLYPPFFAQLLAPLTLASLETAKLIWIATGFATAFTSTWLATGIGGAARSLERAAWCLAAVALYGAVASAAWEGNVSNVIGLGVTLVAMGGVAAGVGGGFIALLKVAPAVLLPAVFVAGRRSRIALIATLAILVGVSLAFAPQAWLEYPAVLRNVFADSVGTVWNFAFVQVASGLGWGADVVGLVRVGTFVAGGVCVVLSVWLARQHGGMPAAALLGTMAMLIIPGTLWFHYLAVLLPFAAMAWPRADAATRCILVASMVVVGLTPNLGQPVVVTLGWVLILGMAGRVLWPPRTSVRSPAP